MELEEEKYKEASDMLDLLGNLRSLVTNYLVSARRSSKRALLEVMADEAEVLTRKARRMRQRWSVYLPFHEVIDVCFDKWAKEIKTWLPALEMTESSLSNDFLLDLVREEPVEELKGELKTVVPDVCSQIDVRLKADLGDWESTVYELKTDLSSSLELAENQLTQLHDELKGLEDFFSSELKEEQFKVLALRLRHRDCQEAVKEAQKEVAKAHNSWPPRYVKNRAGMMKDELKLQLLQDAKLAELKEYIDLDDPELYEDACFGQFLFKNRHELETRDVQELVKKLEMIILLNEKYIDPNGSLRKRVKTASGRDLTEEEKQIVKRLLGFLPLVKWQGGATTDSIALGMKRMLGVGYALDAEMQKRSDELWKLLKSRRNCDAEKSLRVTWLNIVGWCERQSLLSGTSPQLCRLFFPKAGQDEYKAIDKGRQNAPGNFQKVEPLLERFLK